MSVSVEISKTKLIFTLQEVEDLCQRARAAGADGHETFYITTSVGDRPWESDYHTISIKITEQD